TGRPVSWASSNTGVATVNGTGLVSGVAAGSATITATSEGQSGTAAVTVTATPVPVASVDVTPATASVAQGSTVQLTATPRDAAGNVLTGRPVSWASGNTGVASVNGSGLVSGIAAGSATITATSEGQSGTAALTVTVAPPAGLTNECQSPDPSWIWCDDFDQDRLNQYFEYINPGGNSFLRESGVGTEGSHGMRVHFEEGQMNAGALHLAFGRTPDSYFRPVDAGTADYREVYYRMYLKHQVGWGDGGGQKLSRATVFAGSPTSSWAQAMIANFWSGPSRPGETNQSRYYLNMDPASGTDEAGNVMTTQYNDFDNFRWLGRVQGQTPLFDLDHVGRWYCVEVHVRLNDAGSSNGIFEFWIDDQLEARKENMNWLGAYNEYGINAVFFENYWNNPGSHQTQERFFDNIVVSTQPIGCGG
ncbi:MAG: Ig-like domain-containing protein, partial [Gemmatimonadota bacterium]|nr:Ig-like domain-containing protein [Gemmatimonadota bacterium]